MNADTKKQLRDRVHKALNFFSQIRARAQVPADLNNAVDEVQATLEDVLAFLRDE